MDWKKLALAGGAATGVWLLIRHHQRSTVPTDVHASEAVNRAIEEAVPVTSAEEPTPEQAQDPAFWEAMARNIVADLGLGALPPWPGIGPVPHPSLGPVWSTTNWSVTWR
jgi:hypothetical protein